MKRVVLAVISVALFAGVANGAPPVHATADLWLQNPDGGNTINLVISETGIIELWMEFDSSAPAWRLMVGMDAQLNQEPLDPDSNIEVTGFGGPGAADQYGPWDEFYTYSRGILDEAPFDGTPDYTGVGNINYYMYIGSSDPPYTSTSGLEPGGGAMLLDAIIIHGVYDNTDVTGTWGWGDRVFFARLDFAPSWFESFFYDFAGEDTVMEQAFALGTGAKKANPIYVHVVPEPGTLALLAFGGLAAIRRRR